MSQQNISAWNDAEVLEGLNIIDKAELVGELFLLTAVSFRINGQGVSIAEVDGMRPNGSTFTFNDSSSTGIRQQLIEYLTAKGQDHAVESGELLSLRLRVPEGLRVSSYEVDEIDSRTGRPTGKKRQARTYYLTTNGKRVTPATETKPAARTRTAK